MRPFGHREPGPIGATLTDERLVACIIADGHHVDPAAIRLALRAKGTDSIVLVSDMISAAGMPPGTYDLGGQPIYVDGQTSRLSDGTLAGVVLTIDECVRNMVAWGIASIPDAIRMATDNPAGLLGEVTKGRIEEGCDADLVMLDDSLHVQRTFIAGLPMYSAEARPD
jgi:N-acetylglucosamine-6-phosphate deacetylase